MRYFPINLDIAGKKVLVVGGGLVAHRKAKSLKACRAKVTVVSPVFCKGLERMKGLKLVKRNYRKSDIKSACLVISATDSQVINKRVYKDSTAINIPVNVVDQPSLCTFTVPSVANMDELMITISTGGASPALSKRIRKKIERDFGADYSKHLALLKEFRPLVQATQLSLPARMRLLTKMADEQTLKTIKKKGVSATRKTLRDMLSDATGKKG